MHFSSWSMENTGKYICQTKITGNILPVSGNVKIWLENLIKIWAASIQKITSDLYNKVFKSPPLFPDIKWELLCSFFIVSIKDLKTELSNSTSQKSLSKGNRKKVKLCNIWATSKKQALHVQYNQSCGSGSVPGCWYFIKDSTILF